MPVREPLAFSDLHLEVHAEREAERVEPGTHVGRRRGDPDEHGGGR